MALFPIQQNQYLQGNPGASPDANTRWMRPENMNGGMSGGASAPTAPSQQQPKMTGAGPKPGSQVGIGDNSGTMLGAIQNRPAGNYQSQMIPIRPPTAPAPVQNQNPTPVISNNTNYQPQNTQVQGTQDWGNPDTIRAYFASRGVTPNASSPDYWVQKWNEWGKNNPDYFMQRLANADEIIGGPQNSPFAFMANNPNNNASQSQGMFSPAMFQQLLSSLFGGMNFQPNNNSMSTYFQNGNGLNPNGNGMNQGNGFDISSFLRPMNGAGLQ